jgi:predicted NUDIX family NTP pyrophosphohydrolase
MEKTKKAPKGKKSAGILMYWIEDEIIKYFLVHPGGPFWSKKNEGAWTIPKGEIENKEDKQATAIREMYEETGIEITNKDSLIDLDFIKQKVGKVVYAWAYKGQFSGELKCSSMVEMEYPPKSGKKLNFPEVDKGGMFVKEEAQKLINPAQFDFILTLEKLLISENNIK